MLNGMEKVLQMKKFPLEAEAMATFAQRELMALSREELLEYSQQTTMLMSQLRHYASELLSAIEEEGYSFEVKDPGLIHLREH